MTLAADGAQPATARPLVITFSGIDGAGKTTQIDRLTLYLRQRGLRVLRLSFWENVAIWPEFRSGIGYRAIDRKFAAGDAVSFSPRNNKHLRSWYLTSARSAFYLLDVGRLRRLLSRRDVCTYDVVVFDRYIYDQIANVHSSSRLAQAYCKMLLKIAPVPNLALLLDASPAEAFTRKPEYPLEFVHQNRRSFLKISEADPRLVLIPAAGVDEVANQIQSRVDRLHLVVGVSHTEMTEAAIGTGVLHHQTFRTPQ